MIDGAVARRGQNFHQARPRPVSGFGGKIARAAHSHTAADDKDSAESALVGAHGTGRERGKIARFRKVKRGVRGADADVTHAQLPAEFRAGKEQVPALEMGDCHSAGSFHGTAEHCAGVGGDTGRNVQRQHGDTAFVQRLHAIRKAPFDRAGKPHAEHGVHCGTYRPCLVGFQKIRGEKDRNSGREHPVFPRGALAHRAKVSHRARIAPRCFSGIADRHPHARAGKQAGKQKSVPSVVAGAAEHRYGAAGVKFRLQNFHHAARRAFHQHGGGGSGGDCRAIRCQHLFCR